MCCRRRNKHLTFDCEQWKQSRRTTPRMDVFNGQNQNNNCCNNNCGCGCC